TDLNGLSIYFSSDGYVIRMADVHNNYIDFWYSTQGNYGKVLTKIVDVNNNEITISYTSSEVVLTNGDRVVTYRKQLQNGKELLTQVVDPMERTTTYHYDIKA